MIPALSQWAVGRGSTRYQVTEAASPCSLKFTALGFSSPKRPLKRPNLGNKTPEHTTHCVVGKQKRASDRLFYETVAANSRRQPGAKHPQQLVHGFAEFSVCTVYSPIRPFVRGRRHLAESFKGMTLSLATLGALIKPLRTTPFLPACLPGDTRRPFSLVGESATTRLPLS